MSNIAVMKSLLRAFMVLMFPLPFPNGNAHIYQNGGVAHEEELEHDLENGGVANEEEIEHDHEEINIVANGHSAIQPMADPNELWYIGEVQSGVKSCVALNSVEHEVTSVFQYLSIVDTKMFGKALVIDGNLQTTSMDEFIYHESLSHPALLVHDGPKNIFIMGGSGGSIAREVLKHQDIEKVIMCDIDIELVNLCRQHMISNNEVFNYERLQVVYNDARNELGQVVEMFDVILGDISDIRQLGPSNHLYTKSFYEEVAKPKLKEHGIFVTQAGYAGIFSHKDVFSKIYNTLKQVFTHVVAYTTEMPSYRETCGWIMASDEPLNFDAEQLNNRIGERIVGELHYLDGDFITATTVLNKILKTTLMNEEYVITEENMGFVIRGLSAQNGA